MKQIKDALTIVVLLGLSFCFLKNFKEEYIAFTSVAVVGILLILALPVICFLLYKIWNYIDESDYLEFNGLIRFISYKIIIPLFLFALFNILTIHFFGAPLLDLMMPPPSLMPHGLK